MNTAEQITVSVYGPRITGKVCVWDLLSVPKRVSNCPRGFERFTASARVVSIFVKFGHEPAGRWVATDNVVTLTLSPADVLAWRMAGAQLRG